MYLYDYLVKVIQFHRFAHLSATKLRILFTFANFNKYYTDTDKKGNIHYLIRQVVQITLITQSKVKLVK